MISIIVCSVKPEMAQQLQESVSQTIGAECEFIIFDNRECGAGITQVYNYCAERASNELLCFVHEDVLFKTYGWGHRIAAQLREPKCGVIGFAGSTVKSRNYSGWGQRAMYNRCNYTQHFSDGSKQYYSNIDPMVSFERVLTLDGLALFVRKEVWRENKFDEKLLKKFHCYDIDFALQVNLNYNNYICNCVDIEHLSTGSYNEMWLSETMLLHDKKWRKRLPMSIDIEKMTPRKYWRNERAVEYMFVKRQVDSEKDRARRRRIVLSYAKRYWMMNGSIDLIAKHLAR